MIVGGNDYCKVKVVNIIGGLGNQMFQYALYKKYVNKIEFEEKQDTRRLDIF